MDDADTYPSRVRQLREARGLSSAELSRRADIQPPTLSKIELGQRGVSRNIAPKLAKALKVDVPELYAPAGAKIPPPLAEPTHDATTVSMAPRLDLPPELTANARVAVGAPPPPAIGTLTRDVPVWGTGQGGDEGTFLLNEGDVIDWARRPQGIVGDARVFAIYIEGESMVPWRQPGGLVYAHQTRPPYPGGHVIVVFGGVQPGEPPRAMVKKLVRRTVTKLELEQYNPACTVVIDMREVRKLYRVLEWEEVLGI